MSIKNKKRIVIYGGSFNPPHIGHAIAIEAVLRNFQCEEIWVMPSSERLDKHIGISGKNRIAMLKIIIKEYFPNSKIKIRISDLELRRPNLTTTYDTLNELKKRYPSNKFYFLLGSELLRDIRYKWVRGEKLWRSCYFLAIRKPKTKIPSRLPPNIKIIDKNIAWVNVSSTLIRHFIKKDCSGIPYLNPKIAEYIKRNSLYR